MSTKVGRSLDEVSQKIKELNQDLKNSTNQTRQLDRALSFDPGSVELLRDRFSSVKTTVELATKKLDLMRQKYDQMRDEVNAGKIRKEELDKLANSINNAELELRQLQAQYKRTSQDINNLPLQAAQQKLEGMRKGFDGLRNNLEQLQSGLQEMGQLARGVLLGILAAALSANDELGEEMKGIKKQFQDLAVVITKAFLPVIKDLAATVLPILTSLANSFANMTPGAQRMIFLTLVFLAIAPKIVAMVKGFVTLFKLIKVATYGQAAANAALGTASVPLIPMFLAIAAAALVVLGVLAILSKRARDTAKDVTGLTSSLNNVEGDFGSLDSDVSMASSAFSSSNSTRTVEMQVDIYGHGDTEISDGAAKDITIKVSDIIQKELGKLI
jgi:uncharacterized protein YoxC